MTPKSEQLTVPMVEQIHHIRLEEIAPAADNLRADVGDVSELAASIAEAGVLEPLIVTRVKPGETDNGGVLYSLVIGHRRLAGARKAGVPRVPAIIRELDDKQRVEAMLVENLQRADLAPLEEAEGYRRLVALGVGQVELARRIGRSQAHVSKRLSLLKLAPETRDVLTEGGIDLAGALELVPYTREVQLHVLQAIAESIKRKDRYIAPAGQLAAAAAARLELQLKRERALVTLGTAKTSVLHTDEYGYPKGHPTELGKGYGRLPITAKAHAGAGCHAAYVDREGEIRYVCTKPENHLKDPSKAIAKAAKQLTTSRSAAVRGDDRSGAARAKAALKKAAETRERNKVLRAAAPGRAKAIAGQLKARQSREQLLDFTLRQLLQLVLPRNANVARAAAELLGHKPKDRNGEPAWKSYLAGGTDHLVKLAYAFALASGEAPFAMQTARGYFDQELAPNAARMLEHLKAAGSYKPTKVEVDLVADSSRGSWRAAFDK